MDRRTGNAAVPKLGARCSREFTHTAANAVELPLRLSVMCNRIRERPNEAQRCVEALQLATSSSLDFVQ